MARAGKRQSRPLRLRSGVIAALVLIAGLLAAAVAYRRPIAHHLLMGQLRELGLDRVEFAVGRFDLGALELEKLRVGDGRDLEVDRIDARFSVAGLFGSRLDALRISGARLRGRLDDSGHSFGELDALLATRKPAMSAGGPTALPAAGVEIDDVRLTLSTDTGPLEARLDARVLETGSRGLEGTAELIANHPLAELAIDLSAAGAPNSLDGIVRVEASASELLSGQVAARGVSFAAEAEFSFEDGDIAIRSDDCAKLRIAELAIGAAASLARPLDLCLRLGDERALGMSRDGALEANLALEPAAIAVDIGADPERLRVSGVLPIVEARIRQSTSPFEFAVDTEAGRLELSNPEIGIRGIALTTQRSTEPGLPSGRLRIQEIFDRQQPARFASLGVEASFEAGDPGFDVEIQVADPARDLVADVRASHDPESGTGSARAKFDPIDFRPGGVQPIDLIPALADVIAEATGSIALAGSADWRTGETRARLDVDVVDLSVTSPSGNVEQLNTRFSVDLDGTVAIESASWKFAGGTLTTSGTIGALAAKQELTVLANELDLATLVTLINLEGLSGTGTLNGAFPIVRDGEEIAIRNAELHSIGEGDVIRYRPKASVASVGMADDQFATALAVLENFHYERIEIAIDGNPSGEAAVEIHLEGANPDFENGRAVEFNLTVAAALSDLFRAQTFFYRIPDLLERRIRALAGENP